METFSTNHNTATHHKDVPTQQQGSLLLETIHTLGVSSGREGRKDENIYLAILMNHDEMSDGDFFKRLFFLLLIVGAVGQDILQFGGRRKGCPNKYGIKATDGHTQPGWGGAAAGYWPFSVSSRRGRSSSSSSSGHKILFWLNSIAVYGIKGKFRPTTTRWRSQIINVAPAADAAPLKWAVGVPRLRSSSITKSRCCRQWGNSDAN